MTLVSVNLNFNTLCHWGAQNTPWEHHAKTDTKYHLQKGTFVLDIHFCDSMLVGRLVMYHMYCRGKLIIIKGSLNNALYKACVQMYDQHAQERHLLASVLEYYTRVVWLTPKAIGSHYHCEVVYVHFCDRNVCRLGKYLGKI